MDSASPLHDAGVSMLESGGAGEDAGCCEAYTYDPSSAPKDALSESEVLVEERESADKRRQALGLKPSVGRRLLRGAPHWTHVIF